MGAVSSIAPLGFRSPIPIPPKTLNCRPPSSSYAQAKQWGRRRSRISLSVVSAQANNNSNSNGNGNSNGEKNLLLMEQLGRWKDLIFSADPENIAAVGLTGLLAWASVQALFQLLFISLAIVLAALKYSFIAALLLFILITLL